LDVCFSERERTMTERVTPTEWFRGIAREVAEHVSVEEAREIIAQEGIQEEIARRVLHREIETLERMESALPAEQEDPEPAYIPPSVGLLLDVAKMTHQAYKLRAEEQDPDKWHAFYFPETDGSRTLSFSRDISAVFKVVPVEGVPIGVAGRI
jgi:hypothetical protein